MSAPALNSLRYGPIMRRPMITESVPKRVLTISFRTGMVILPG